VITYRAALDMSRNLLPSQRAAGSRAVSPRHSVRAEAGSRPSSVRRSWAALVPRQDGGRIVSQGSRLADHAQIGEIRALAASSGTAPIMRAESAVWSGARRRGGHATSLRHRSALALTVLCAMLF
jgi:hypothetical protein